MEDQLDISFPDDSKYESRDRFAKLIIGTAAGFIAGKIAENVYDSLMARHRSHRI